MLKIFKRLVLSVCLIASLFAAEYAGNDWMYVGFWNMYNSGIERPRLPALAKNPADAAKWNATMRLKTYHLINDYVGGRFYFITQYTGADTVRLAPSFYALKDKKEYKVWWNIPGTKNQQFVSFTGKQGLIVGALDIPAPETAEYYAQLDGETPFRITNTSALTIADVRSGLRTDWQHDIPGEYAVSAQETFPGLYGEAVFERFYLGDLPPHAVLSPEDGAQFGQLSAREREILANECGLPSEVFRGAKLPKNYYFCSRRDTDNALQYYGKYKNMFGNDIYFLKKNYLPRGANGFNLQVIAKEPGLGIVNEDNLIFTAKRDASSWTIVSLGEIDSPQALAELKGPARLTAWYKAKGLTPGHYGWQTVFLDVVQYDKDGQILGNGNLAFPAFSRQTIKDYSGVVENEFIVAKDAARLEVLLKIPGAPDTDKTKLGAVLDNFVLDKVALQKGSGVLELEKLFAAGQPLGISGGTAILNPAKTGLFVGDRSFTLDAAKRAIRFDLKSAGDYSGFYTNIFKVSDIDELEVSAIMDSKLQAFGNPPDWAVNCIEIVYFAENGQQVYPAETGAERFPKISAPQNTRQTEKGLFVVPRELNAAYAQIKMHFSRVDDPAFNRPDERDYYLGQASAEQITLRPALQPYNRQNFLPADGTFYDNIAGQPLSWTVQSAYVEENLTAAKRKVVFDNPNPGGWSALKTIIDIPEEANALRGKMSVDVQQIETGLAQWEGFGFFVEADVLTPGGALFHYSGIPVFEVSGNQFVRLGRFSLRQKREIEYYIPLYHENQKIVKLHWQLALLGKGRVELLPLSAKTEASILKVELLKEEAFNPLLWSQYALYSAGAKDFQFQKGYELKTADGASYTYEYAEILAERLLSSGLENKNIVEELKALELDAVKKTARYEVKAIPAYGRVATYAQFDGQVVEASFKTSGTKDARFNLQAYIIDEENGNVRQAPIYRLEPNGQWKTIDRVFEVGRAERFVIDSSEYPGEAKTLMLTLGGFHGIVNYADLTLTQYTRFDKRNLSGKKNEIKISALGKNQILSRSTDMDNLNNENLANLDYAKPLAFLSPQAQNLDKQIRAAVQNNRLSFNKGAWSHQGGKTFTLNGFTLVGETFQKWQELRRKEFAQKQNLPYWWKDSEAQTIPLDYENYFLLFAKSQSNIWKKAGINTIRVHQLFTNWANFSEKDFDLLVRVLQSWQKEGFVIVVDVFPNTDFTGAYFGKEFGNKPRAKFFSDFHDLFKATLVLPEVQEQYVRPGLAKVVKTFNKYNFWPNEITYENETGFTHGFWTIDKNNPQAEEYFSRAYHYYYGRYLEQIKNDKAWQDFVSQGDALIQAHLQHVRLKQLLSEVSALNKVIGDKYYVKDTGGYICYNVLRDEIVNAFPLYKTELLALREDGFRWITDTEPTGNYIEQSAEIARANKARLNKMFLQIELEQTKTADALQKLLVALPLKNKIKELHSAVFAAKMPADYKIPADLTLAYIDDFTNYSREQSFFTSFLLPVVFRQDMNAFLRQQTKQKFVVGLNNDYIRDVGALLGQAYVFYNDADTELRFNKYTHHPIGGHSMLLHPGFGNVFDEDSNLALNLELFTPPAIYPAQLSETNYTYVGDDNAGQGAWTVMDYLKIAAQKNNILFFHNGPNAKDKPIINDYFNMGNRPYQQNTMALAASAALHKSLDPQYIKSEDFQYDSFQKKIDLAAKGINGVAGKAERGAELKGRAVSLVYQGARPFTNVTLIEQKLGSNATAVYLFGLERNLRQKIRSGQPNLLQSYGLDTIQYEHIPAQVILSERKITKITGYTPSGETVEIPLQNVKTEKGKTILNLTDFPQVVCYYLEH